MAAAEELARSLGTDPNHTVAAAAMDTAGRIYTAVNVVHFTGGPCAQLVAWGVAAAADAGPLLTMAAAGDRSRGLIPPCGRCRQVMLDLHPDLRVAVPTDDGPVMRPVRRLLPDSSFVPDAVARRVMRFNKRYYEAVISGEKTVTVCWDDPITIGLAIFVFEDHPESARIDGEVLTIDRHRLDGLTAEQAKMPAGADVAALISGLKTHYPDMPHNAMVDVITFTTAQHP
ncbi:ASCH domain-containing protein [Kribbella catacumbae]|uniref:ASCH domain-containing protein n=1 Tax=Kribbella catacumbae TaxID=460086 RepID=UPI000361D96C|nr:ASCH domain-containing protein [Kribbella catacumbae]